MADAYLTTGEFERTTNAMREEIREGFRVTHAKQDHTNGRLRVAEQKLEVLSRARLIDRTDKLESSVQELQSEARRDDDDERSARQHWSGVQIAFASAGAGLVSSLVILALKAWLKL